MDVFEIRKVEPVLKYLIHGAIVNSVRSTVKRCEALGNSPHEPDFVASLVIEFTSDLSKILQLLFHGYAFSISGVYCHQKPIVHAEGISPDPELGDILLVYIDHRTKMYNSLLLQAKRSSRLDLKIERTDFHQFQLYYKWPRFTYQRSGHLNGKTRDIWPKSINDGAQYLLIDSDLEASLKGIPGNFPMGCAIPNQILSINNDLATEVVDFLKFKAGRIFEERPTRDDWSNMIWDLLDITKCAMSKRRNSGRIFPRENTRNLNFSYFHEKTPFIHDFFDIEGDNNTNYNEDIAIPSIILIQSHSLNGY